MLDKIYDIKKQYKNLSDQLSDPIIATDVQAMIALGRQISTLEPIYVLGCQYEKACHEITEAETILKTEIDEDMIQMAKDQLSDAKQCRDQREKDLVVALLPKDENDERNIYMEIRPAA
jgi:peptide chain release factor 1